LKRYLLDLGQVGSWNNLAWAAHRAALGKRDRLEVQAFFANLFPNLAKLREGLLAGRLPAGRFFRFKIWDPKPRIIYAPCFEDRILHHALMRFCEPVLDRALIPNTFACRIGKGTLAAVNRARIFSQQLPWYGKVDMAAYFDSIDHMQMFLLLLRKFKGQGVAALFERILEAYTTKPGKGLPIGALTSQIFANFYLDGLDRFVTETLKAPGYVRYMDDVVWWGPTRGAVRSALPKIKAWVGEHRGLTLKENTQINRSQQGLPFLGYRIFHESLRLNRRRKQRYVHALGKWEERYQQGELSALGLQQAYASVHAIVAHADCGAWRKNLLHQRRELDV